MSSHLKALETLKRAVDTSTYWHSGFDLGENNIKSIDAYKKLQRLGLVFATFSRTRRHEDFHTLPRNQANTTIFDLLDGTTRELPSGTSLQLHEAPIITEVLADSTARPLVFVEYCLAQEDENPFFARHRVFTPAPLITFVPKS